MSETITREVQIIFSAGGQYYAVLDILRTCGAWLSIDKRPLPVPGEWHRPGTTFAAVMRGRDYYRIGVYGLQRQDGSKSVPLDDELVKDWCDASWWTPGLEEAWAEADGMAAAMCEAQRQIKELSAMHVCEAPNAKRSDSKSGGKRG